jgi:hypothetical protein
VDPRVGMDDLENILDPTGTRNSDPLVAHADYAVPTPANSSVASQVLRIS